MLSHWLWVRYKRTTEDMLLGSVNPVSPHLKTKLDTCRALWHRDYCLWLEWEVPGVAWCQWARRIACIRTLLTQEWMGTCFNRQWSDCCDGSRAVCPTGRWTALYVVLNRLDYCSVIWGGLGKTDIGRMQKINFPAQVIWVHQLWTGHSPSS